MVNFLPGAELEKDIAAFPEGLTYCGTFILAVDRKGKLV